FSYHPDKLSMERTEDSAFGPVDRIGQLTMRNLDIADSRTRLEQYAGLGMVGTGQSALLQAPPAPPTELIGDMPEGGAEAIASRGDVADDAEALDRAAMEFGTDCRIEDRAVPQGGRPDSPARVPVLDERPRPRHRSW